MREERTREPTGARGCGSLARGRRVDSRHATEANRNRFSHIQVVMATEEVRWVAEARRGDRNAFRHLVEAYSRALFALCMRITRDAAMAEDAVQEAFFNAHRHLGDFDGRSGFKTWLHRIAVNAALEQLRRNSKHG